MAAPTLAPSIRKLPSQDKIDKLKVLIRIDGSPKWYEYDG